MTDFEKQLEKSLKKVQRSAQRNNRAFANLSKKDYWIKEEQKSKGNAKSWDALVGLIATDTQAD